MRPVGPMRWRVALALLSMIGSGGLVAVSLADEALAQRETFAGTVDFFATGEPLAIDTNANGNVDTLAQPASVDVTSTDIASGATLVKAFLYWAGSVPQPAGGDCAEGAHDDQVDFTPPGGSLTSVTADVFYCAEASGSLDMQAYRADVTNLVGSLVGTYTVDNFSAQVADGSTDNASFSIVLIFSTSSLPGRRIVLYDGLQTFSSNSDTLTLGGFDVASPSNGKLTWYVLDGDTSGTGTEEVSVDGMPGGAGPVTLSDAVNPANNPMNHTINTQSPVRTDTEGMDIDQFDVSSALAAGDTSVDVTYSAGTDSWRLVYNLLASDDDSSLPPAVSVDGAVEATSFSGDGSSLGGVATDSELAAHASDPNAHGGGHPISSAPGTADASRPVHGGELHGESAHWMEMLRFHADFFAIALCEAIDYRYVDRGDGTILDCTTGLIWLEDASCLGRGFWDPAGRPGSAQALVVALNASSGESGFDCEDYVNGTYTDWRLPTMEELCGSWDGECSGRDCCRSEAGIIDHRFSAPAVAGARGDVPWSEGAAFTGIHSGSYWSTNDGWSVSLEDGYVEVLGTAGTAWVWPVRDSRAGRR